MSEPVWLRTITPISTGLALVPGTELRDEDAYRGFWTQLAQHADELRHGATTLELSHAAVHTRGLYARLSEDALAHPLHVLHATFAPLVGSDQFGAIDGIELRLYDHNVAIVEFVTDVSALLDSDEALPQRVDALEQATTAAGQHVLQEVVAPWIGRVLPTLATLAPTDSVVDIDAEREVAQLWTARALFCPRERLVRGGLAREWLRNAEVSINQVAQLETGELDHVATWLNYVFVSADPARDVMLPPGGDGTDAWDGLRYAQYYYAALDQVDRRLALVLAQTHVDLSGARLARLRDDLTWESQRADQIRIERQLTEKYLRRPVRAVMLEILAGWSFDELVAEPVREKTALCTTRVQAIAEAQSRRASIWTDLILLGIAITSILGTALSVAAFGRSLGTEPSMAGYDSGTSTVTEWLASQPADSILLASLVVSAGVAAVYLIYRRASE